MDVYPGKAVAIVRFKMSIVVCEWEPEGDRKFDGNAGAMVIVDVLSFSTHVDLAVAHGAMVYPYPYGDFSAAAVAARTIGAEIAGLQGITQIPLQLVAFLAVRDRSQ
jgi:hypothetical protein